MTGRNDDGGRSFAAGAHANEDTGAIDGSAPRAPHGTRGARAQAFEHGSATDPGTGRLLSPLVEPSLQALDSLTVEAVALCITSDVRPLAGLASYVDWRLCGRLSALLISGALRGAQGECVLMPSLGMIRPQRLFLFGWGPRATLQDDAPARLEQLARVLLRARCDSVAVALPEPGGPLVHLVEQHIRRVLGSSCRAVFAPDPLLSAPSRPRVAKGGRPPRAS